VRPGKVSALQPAASSWPWKGRAGTCFWPGQKQESHHHITVSLFLWLPGRLLEAAEADLHAPQLKSLLMLLCIYPALGTNTTNLNYK